MKFQFCLDCSKSSAYLLLLMLLVLLSVALFFYLCKQTKQYWPTAGNTYLERNQFKMKKGKISTK